MVKKQTKKTKSVIRKTTNRLTGKINAGSLLNKDKTVPKIHKNKSLKVQTNSSLSLRHFEAIKSNLSKDYRDYTLHTVYI